MPIKTHKTKKRNRKSKTKYPENLKTSPSFILRLSLSFFFSFALPSHHQHHHRRRRRRRHRCLRSCKQLQLTTATPCAQGFRSYRVLPLQLFDHSHGTPHFPEIPLLRFRSFRLLLRSRRSFSLASSCSLIFFLSLRPACPCGTRTLSLLPLVRFVVLVRWCVLFSRCLVACTCVCVSRTMRVVNTLWRCFLDLSVRFIARCALTDTVVF